ncbi:MAG: SMP-30/gluconolactonase/LRE family protein [Alphaproteobacteria bacterium]
MRRRLLRLLGALIFFGIFYLLFWPVSIDPVAWTPPQAPTLTGPYALNNKLAAATRFGAGIGIGPEDIAIDAKGWIHTGFIDGRIVAIAPDGKTHKVIANTGGRPLGMRFDADGNLIVTDASKGLLSIAPGGTITVLATQAEKKGFGFTNHLAIATDGTIYFSDSSTRWGPGKAVADIFEHVPTGRLMAYDPKAKTVRVLMRKLQYANGVALAADESFVLVNESGEYRIRRHWLKGPKAGQSDIFIDNLPGFPDNISANGKGTFWLAMFTVRNPAADALAKQSAGPRGPLLASDERGRARRHALARQPVGDLARADQGAGELAAGLAKETPRPALIMWGPARGISDFGRRTRSTRRPRPPGWDSRCNRDGRRHRRSPGRAH